MKTNSLIAINVLAIAIAMSSSSGAWSQGTFPINDFDANQNLEFRNEDGNVVAIVNAPDPNSNDPDMELRITTDSITGFQQYTDSAGVFRTGGVIESLVSGSAIEATFFSFAGDLSQNTNIRIAINTNAWPTNPSNNYRTFDSITLDPNMDDTETLVFDYSSDQEVMGAFQNWEDGQGTFLQIYFDNQGGTNSAGDIFYMDDVIVSGVPTPGDVNGDSMVDPNDFDIIRNNFFQAFADRSDGDLVDNDFIDFADFRDFKNAFEAPPLSAATSVPEPSSGLLLVIAWALGGSAALRRYTLDRDWQDLRSGRERTVRHEKQKTP